MIKHQFGREPCCLLFLLFPTVLKARPHPPWCNETSSGSFTICTQIACGTYCPSQTVFHLTVPECPRTWDDGSGSGEDCGTSRIGRETERSQESKDLETCPVQVGNIYIIFIFIYLYKLMYVDSSAVSGNATVGWRRWTPWVVPPWPGATSPRGRRRAQRPPWPRRRRRSGGNGGRRPGGRDPPMRPNSWVCWRWHWWKMPGSI